MTGARSLALRLRTVVLAIMLASLAGLPAASPSVAASIAFGTPTADARYDQSITFTVDLTTTAPMERVELWLRFPDTIGPYVVTVDDPATTGTRSLQYVLDLTGGGHLVPNTRFQATWAAYPSAGATPTTSRVLDVNYQDTTKDWRTVKGDIVTVHWYQGDKAFADKALAIGEKAIADTSELLGVTETESVDFFIYADDSSFRDALGPGTRENVGGEAHSDIRTLFALITPGEINDPWVGTVIPHELVHLVFDTAVNNPYRFPPRWLNEGLAVYLSEQYGARDRSLVADAVSSGSLMPLTALSGQFPTEFDRTSLAYAESVSAIDYLVRTFGQDTLVSLVKAYKDGLTDDEAFSRALGEDLAAFQAGWLAELGAQPPQQYGPVPAPSGPVPPEWTVPQPTAATNPATGAGATDGLVASATPVTGAVTGPDQQNPASPAAGGGTDVALLILLAAVVITAIAGGALLLARRRPWT